MNLGIITELLKGVPFRTQPQEAMGAAHNIVRCDQKVLPI